MKKIVLLLVGLVLGIGMAIQAQKVAAQWNFEGINNGSTVELMSKMNDTIEGNYEQTKGAIGSGIRLDGFTTCLKTNGRNRVIHSDSFTIEAWVALGNYPWNWCPVISTISKENKGYRLLIGPLGQASFEVAIGEQWIACSSADEAIPLRTWMHLTATYTANEQIELFINGKSVGTTTIHESISFPNEGYQIGMVAQPHKPSDIHRTWGTIEQFFGLDGIIDEITIYDKALSSSQINGHFDKVQAGLPDIAPRKLPKIAQHPGRFGAFYTKLKYYPGWDNLWPVDQDPDIVVCFDESPIKVVFWRGIRYGASWVSENENWMSDQSVEAWGVGENDNEGCFEHMQDRHCRFSHVRIIENTPARVVIHWRYAPTSAYLSTWRPDPKTGWECWIDEYYYIYPDATGIRKVSWKKGSLGYPRQFQETLALLHPGQKVSDLLEIDNALVSDYEGNTDKQSFVENPKPLDWSDTKDFTIQQYQFKSQHKPFICFEPGNKMNLRDGRLKTGYDRAAGCNHFPVGQARCDGRTTRTSDRPSHATSFPISDPVLHSDGERNWWNGLYGMNKLGMEDLVQLGRAWAYAPEIVVEGEFESQGYDRSERVYQIKGKGKREKEKGKRETLSLKVKGTKDSPIWNPAFYVKGWNGEAPEVWVDGALYGKAKLGLKYELEGTDLVVYLPIKRTGEVIIELKTK